MKKIFKALAITAATAALGTGVAFATGCNGGDGTYYGEYHYLGAHGSTYGIVVEVTVKNNIITKVKNLTNTDNEYAKSVQKDDKGNAVTWTFVSPGWETYAAASDGGLLGYTYWAYPDADFSGMTNAEKEQYVKDNPLDWYSWLDKNASNWTNHENWLFQQYEGKSVADVLAVNVFTDYAYKAVTVDGSTTYVQDYGTLGEPCAVDFNAELEESGLLISGATQGSGRVMLAVQNALNSK